MLINEVRKKVRADLESPPELRRVGTGWLSGVAALVAAVAGLFFVLCLRYPGLLTVPQIRGLYARPAFRLGLHFLLIAAFALAIVSLVLRANRVLGFTAIAVTLLATVLGGSRVHATARRRTRPAAPSSASTGSSSTSSSPGFLFVPLERLFARRRGQPLFRVEWREDLFYYLVSSLLVQVLTFLSMSPADR